MTRPDTPMSVAKKRRKHTTPPEPPVRGRVVLPDGRSDMIVGVSCHDPYIGVLTQ